MSSHEATWIIDSYTSLHLTPHHEFCSYYTSGEFYVLKLSNDEMTRVVCMRDICLKTDIDASLILRDVRHAPDICLNLIFTAMLDNVGLL